MSAIYYKIGDDLHTLDSAELTGTVGSIHSAIVNAHDYIGDYIFVELAFHGVVLNDFSSDLPPNAGASATNALSILITRRF